MPYLREVERQTDKGDSEMARRTDISKCDRCGTKRGSLGRNRAGEWVCAKCDTDASAGTLPAIDRTKPLPGLTKWESRMADVHCQFETAIPKNKRG